MYAAAVLAFYRAAMFSHEASFTARRRISKPSASPLEFAVRHPVSDSLRFSIRRIPCTDVRKHYGTASDGEYLPLATGPVRNIFLFLCEPLVMPLIAAFRFLILAPLTWISPRSRNWVYRRASSMVIELAFVRPLPGRASLACRAARSGLLRRRLRHRRGRGFGFAAVAVRP